MRLITFEKNAFNEYQKWIETDRKLAIRIGEIIKDILRDPLKGDFKGYWSRRITEEHRLIYKVTTESIIIISRYSHYN
jgi:toxin YoeB